MKAMMGAAKGGWGRNGRTAVHVKQGDLSGASRDSLGPSGVEAAAPQQPWPMVRVGATGRDALTDAPQTLHNPTGVRASIVAQKRGNTRGAKGRRKVEAR